MPALPLCLLCILSLPLTVADVRPSPSYDWVAAFMAAEAAVFLYLHRPYRGMLPNEPSRRPA